MPTESQISTARQHVDQVLQRLCGMRLADLDAESTFLELGFDSLFLIQFAQRLKAQSGVKVSFRQLIEDISTPLALTEFLAGQVSAADAIPSDAPPASSPGGPSGDARPGDHGAVPSVAASCQQYADSVPQQSRGVETSAPATQPRTPIDTGGLDPRRAALAQIIAQQNELMALQLQLLSGASMSKATPRSLPDISLPTDTPSRAAATPAQAAVAGRSTDAASAAASPSTGAPATADPAVSVAAATPANSPLPSEKGQQLSRKPDKHFERFGPYKPVRKSSDGSLTASQRAHLDAFIERFTRKTAGSRRLAEQHRRHFADPRGVAAYRRIWKAMVYQIAVDKSQGARLWDIDGNEYIDIAMGFGLNLFGHSPEFIRRRIHQQLDRGVEIGPQFPLAGEVAALLCALTGMDRATFCNTGSEAVMAAMRVARTVTGKPKVVYFNKDYHGNFDEVLLRSTAMGDRHVTQPAAPGIPDALCETMVVLPYGRPESLLAIAEQADDIAAVLVEPVQSADPFLQPREFLIELRELTRQRDIALIMDEVITGFRTAAGGAQEHFGVQADLATYGKILGGGLPIGALAGSSRFMDALDGGSWQYDDASEPTADMTFFAGTFVRHPLAIVAAHEVLMRIKEESPQLQRALTQRTQRLAQRLNTFFESEQFPIRVAQFASLFRLMFPSDLEFPDLLYFHLLDRGIFTRGWGDNCFLSTEHSDADVESIVAAVEDSCRELRRAGFFHDPVASFATAAAGVMDLGQQPGGQHSRRGTDVVDEPLQRDALSRPELSDEGDSDPFAPFPLTEMQQEILMTSKVSPLAAAANNEPFALHLHGAVDIDLLRRSIRHVLARHPALRLQVDVANGLQRILPEVEFPIREHDPRALDDAARSDTFHRLAVELAATCVDASAEPLVRVEILRMADDHTAVLFDGHHIASDGWSWNILLEEIGATYSAGVAGRSPQLPEPASFRQWVSDGGRRTSQEAEDLQYWAEQFADPPLPLELPTLRPRPKRQEYAASSVSMEIPQEIVQRIAALATNLQVSPSSVALAAWKLLLARLSGQHDIVVGIRTAQQALLENPHLVGLCMSVLPIRTQVRFDASAADLIRAVHGRQMDAIEHQQCDLGRIVRHVRPPRHPGHMPLTDMHFNFFRDSSNITFAGLQHQIRVTPKAAINHDLFLNVTDTCDAWVIDADFRSDLYDAVTVRTWLEHYCAILDSMAQSPDAPVGRTALYRDANLERVLNTWNSRQVDYPRDHCVTDLVAAQSQRSPDAVAIACGGEQQTYQQIEAASNRLARLLLQRGVRPGDYVGVLVERTPRMLVATLAVMKAGAAYVPMDAEFPDERLEFMCRDAEVKLAITDSAYQDRPCLRGVECLLLDVEWRQMATLPSIAPEVAPRPDDTAYVIYTSGSTGVPKGVQIAHRALVNFLWSMRASPGCTADDTLAAVTTLSFDIAGLELYLPLIVGGRIELVSQRDATDGFRLGRILDQQGVTILQATPATWRLLLESGWSGKPDLKMLCGGEAMPSDLPRRLLPLGAELWNMYGPTETTIWSAAKQIVDPEGRITIGRPIANTQIYILDERDELAPIGAAGRLYIAGDGLARGYLNRPELTAERFRTIELPTVDGRRQRAQVYDTGDLARWLPDGEIDFIGRADFQVKISGYRIELGEVESVLAAHPDVEQCVAWVTEDESGHRLLVAYARLASRSVDGTLLREFLKQKLPAYMVPALVEIVDAFPLTPNGKIDRQRLPRPVARAASSAVKDRPATDTQRFLAETFGEVLGVPEPGMHDDLFALGGHSLSATRIIGRLSRRFPLELTIADIFEFSTIAELAAHIDAQLHPQPRREESIPRATRAVRRVRFESQEDVP